MATWTSTPAPNVCSSVSSSASSRNAPVPARRHPRPRRGASPGTRTIHAAQRPASRGSRTTSTGSPLEALEKDPRPALQRQRAGPGPPPPALDDEAGAARSQPRLYTIHKFVPRHRIDISAATFAGLAISRGTIWPLSVDPSEQRSAAEDEAAKACRRRTSTFKRRSARPIQSSGAQRTCSKKLSEVLSKKPKHSRPPCHSSTPALLDAVEQPQGPGRIDERHRAGAADHRRTLGPAYREVAEDLAGLENVLFHRPLRRGRPFRRARWIDLLPQRPSRRRPRALNDVAMTLQRRTATTGSTAAPRGVHRRRTRFLGERRPDITSLDDLAMLLTA